MTGPDMKILLLDIETAPNIATVWGLWNQNIGINQILDSGYTLCWAAKWLGSDEAYYDSLHYSTNRRMIKRIHSLLNEADVVVHFNGSKFDIPTLNKEFLLLGLPPPSPFKQIDLLKVVRKQFRFPSNKLNYIAQSLGLGSKAEHRGHSLWLGCMNNDQECWQEMEDYNIQDVHLLEDVYNKVLPWISNHPNRGLYGEDSHVCPKCGGTKFHKRGWAITLAGKYQRYQCSSCGGWFRDAKKNEAPPSEERYANA